MGNSPATTAGKYPRENDVYCMCVCVCIYVYIRGGTVHRCHGSVRTSVRGSRFDTISVQQEKKQIYYAQSLFIYFEQTVVQIKKNSHLDVKILNIMLYI